MHDLQITRRTGGSCDIKGRLGIEPRTRPPSASSRPDTPAPTPTSPWWWSWQLLPAQPEAGLPAPLGSSTRSPWWERPSWHYRSGFASGVDTDLEGQLCAPVALLLSASVTESLGTLEVMDHPPWSGSGLLGSVTPPNRQRRFSLGRHDQELSARIGIRAGDGAGAVPGGGADHRAGEPRRAQANHRSLQDNTPTPD